MKKLDLEAIVGLYEHLIERLEKYEKVDGMIWKHIYQALDMTIDERVDFERSRHE